MGCGLTRAFCSMVHLQFNKAIDFHLLAPVLLLYLTVAWVRALFHIRPKGKWWNRLGKWMIFAFMIFYCGRMVMFFSTPEGLASPLKKNIFSRMIRGDFTNTPEPWEENSHPPLDNK